MMADAHEDGDLKFNDRRVNGNFNHLASWPGRESLIEGFEVLSVICMVQVKPLGFGKVLLVFCKIDLSCQ